MTTGPVQDGARDGPAVVPGGAGELQAMSGRVTSLSTPASRGRFVPFPSTAPADLLAALAEALGSLGAGWYLFGAQAALVWGRPRRR